MESPNMQEISQYIRLADAILYIAKQGFFVRLCGTTKEIVHFLLESIFWVDNHIDSLDSFNRGQAVKAILHYLGGEENLKIDAELEVRKSLAVLKDILDKSSEAQRVEFLSKASAVFACNNILFSARTPREFVLEREKEARSTADMILALADELGSSKKFAEFLREAAVIGNMIDSIEDAREDRACGKLAIDPTRLYFALAQKALTRAVTAIKIHPQKRNVIGLGLTWLLRHVGLKSNVPWQAEEILPGHARIRPSCAIPSAAGLCGALRK
jgi:hypothetical protein